MSECLKVEFSSKCFSTMRVHCNLSGSIDGIFIDEASNFHRKFVDEVAIAQCRRIVEKQFDENYNLRRSLKSFRGVIFQDIEEHIS